MSEGKTDDNTTASDEELSERSISVPSEMDPSMSDSMIAIDDDDAPTYRSQDVEEPGTDEHQSIAVNLGDTEMAACGVSSMDPFISSPQNPKYSSPSEPLDISDLHISVSQQSGRNKYAKHTLPLKKRMLSGEDFARQPDSKKLHTSMPCSLESLSISTKAGTKDNIQQPEQVESDNEAKGSQGDSSLMKYSDDTTIDKIPILYKRTLSISSPKKERALDNNPQPVSSPEQIPKSIPREIPMQISVETSASRQERREATAQHMLVASSSQGPVPSSQQDPGANPLLRKLLSSNPEASSQPSPETIQRSDPGDNPLLRKMLSSSPQHNLKANSQQEPEAGPLQFQMLAMEGRYETSQTATQGTSQTARLGVIHTVISGVVHTAAYGVVQTATSGVVQTATSGTSQTARSGTSQPARPGTMERQRQIEYLGSRECFHNVPISQGEILDRPNPLWNH